MQAMERQRASTLCATRQPLVKVGCMIEFREEEQILAEDEPAKLDDDESLYSITNFPI